MPELEIWLCPVHESLDKSGKLKPLDNCVACLRAERDELLAEVASLRLRRAPVEGGGCVYTDDKPLKE